MLRRFLADQDAGTAREIVEPGDDGKMRSNGFLYPVGSYAWKFEYQPPAGFQDSAGFGAQTFVASQPFGPRAQSQGRLVASDFRCESFQVGVGDVRGVGHDQVELR